MKRFGFFACAIVATVFSTASVASPSDIDKRKSRAYSACIDASGGVTVEMLDCNGAELDMQDARLNQAYRMVMARLAPAQKTHLRTLQRKWLVTRERRCSFPEETGTLGTVMRSGCFLDETIARTIWLERYKP